MNHLSPLKEIDARELVGLANELIMEMVSILADLKAPPASASFNAKFDRFYAEGFGIGNPEIPQDDIVLSVLDEMNGGTTIQ
jgi:hypothetical protein